MQREQEQAHADTAADEEPGDGPGDGGVVVEPVHVGCKGPPALRKEAEPVSFAAPTRKGDLELSATRSLIQEVGSEN